MRQTPKKVLEDFVISESIGATLEANAFEKRRLTWIRFRRGVAHVADFQWSRFSELGSTSFTINLGVALEEVWQIYYGRGLDNAIDEADCFPHFRAGDVLSGFDSQAKDVWWDLNSTTSRKDLALEIKSILLERCLPILGRLDSLAAVVDFVEREAPLRYPHPYTRIVWAIVRYLSGQVESGESELQNLETDSKLSEEWRMRAREVRRRLGASLRKP